MRRRDKFGFTNINIIYNGEAVDFNLIKQVKINPDLLGPQLKKQPEYYGFCLLLHKKLLAKFEKLKMERRAIKGKLFLYAKQNKVSPQGRPYSDDLANAWVDNHKKFKEISQKCIKAREEADIIYAAVKSLEQRKDLMQTISSNIRSES